MQHIATGGQIFARTLIECRALIRPVRYEPNIRETKASLPTDLALELARTDHVSEELHPKLEREIRCISSPS